MSNKTNNLSELTENLFSNAGVVLSTDNQYEQDRWGTLLGMEIHGLRINDYVAIFSYIKPDEEGHSLCELEEICHVDKLFDRAEYLHQCYYEKLPVAYYIDKPEQLKNRSAKVCNILDQYYTPAKEFIPTPPSEILPIITKKDVYESGKEWAWFDRTVFLTQSTKKRTGLMKFGNVFDKSIKDIFQQLKINVCDVALNHYDPKRSLVHNIKSNIKSAKISDLEYAIEVKKGSLERLKSKVVATEEEILDLYSELNELKSIL